MARVLKGSHSFTCTPRVHPLTEWTIPAFSFPAEAGTHLPTPEGWKAELALGKNHKCSFCCNTRKQDALHIEDNKTVFQIMCNVIDADAIHYKVLFDKINRLVHKHFSDSCLVWCLSWCLLVFISVYLLAYCVYFLCLLFCTCFLVCSALVANKRTHIGAGSVIPFPILPIVYSWS